MALYTFCKEETKQMMNRKKTHYDQYSKSCHCLAFRFIYFLFYFVGFTIHFLSVSVCPHQSCISSVHCSLVMFAPSVPASVPSTSMVCTFLVFVFFFYLLLSSNFCLPVLFFVIQLTPLKPTFVSL